MTALPASLDLLITEAEAATPEGVEQQKIRAAQAGDMAAFEWIVQQHEERLFGFCCRWLRCMEDAREVCQDAFVRAWQALPEFEGRAKLSTWLYQIALNLCRDRAKTRAARQRDSTIALEDVEQPPLCPQQTPSASAELNSEMQKLERGLAVMPEKLRAVLMLTTMEGLSHEECAQVMNCSTRGVEGRVYRARQMLLKWWDEER
ncbi:MAG: RNA polymerase sigma factor [Verrucomicrobiota bacterium]|jgi:RNA polymerase sigma-70 factor (ECF subfamily)|nr:RNA polymerase sigma factor [Verrucomicrobiaceae bacterium]MDH4454531.1 RNA polymerase sigma factor [Verrucomicrobiota bacterium]